MKMKGGVSAWDVEREITRPHTNDLALRAATAPGVPVGRAGLLLAISTSAASYTECKDVV